VSARLPRVSSRGLATMENRNFDAVVLDPHSLSSPTAEVISRIDEFHPNLLKRCSACHGGGAGIQRLRIWPSATQSPMSNGSSCSNNFGAAWKRLLRSDAVPQDVTPVARLISDSLHGPAPSRGARFRRDRSRRLLFSSGSLTVDLLVEPEADSNRIALWGQILDSARPDRRFCWRFQ